MSIFDCCLILELTLNLFVLVFVVHKLQSSLIANRESIVIKHKDLNLYTYYCFEIKMYRRKFGTEHRKKVLQEKKKKRNCSVGITKIGSMVCNKLHTVRKFCISYSNLFED